MPTFVAPGPAFDAKAKAGGKTLFVIPASSQRAVRVDDLGQHETDRLPGRRQGDGLGQPGPALAVGAGHERGDRAGGERDRAPCRQRSGRRCSRRSRRRRRRASRRSSRTSTTTTRSPAPNVGGLVNIPYQLAGELIADQAILDTDGEGERARRHDQPGQVDRADGERDQVAVLAVLQGLQAGVHGRDDRRYRDEDPAERPGRVDRRPGHQLRDLSVRLGRGAVRRGRDPRRRPHRQGQDLDLQRHAERAQGRQEGRHRRHGRRREPRLDRLRDHRSVDADHGRAPRGEGRPRAGAHLRPVEHRRRPAPPSPSGWGNAYVAGYKKLWQLQ